MIRPVPPVSLTTPSAWAACRGPPCTMGNVFPSVQLSITWTTTADAEVCGYFASHGNDSTFWTHFQSYYFIITELVSRWHCIFHNAKTKLNQKRQRNSILMLYLCVNTSTLVKYCKTFLQYLTVVFTYLMTCFRSVVLCTNMCYIITSDLFMKFWKNSINWGVLGLKANTPQATCFLVYERT